MRCQIVVEKIYRPGEKLPNDVELCEKMGIGRSTLREAVRELILQRVLEVRRGKGTFIIESVEEDYGFSNLERVQSQLRDLFELRSIFEPKAAALACRRATEEELTEILEQGARVEQCIQAGEDRTESDRAFHTAIVRATHNEFMLRLLPLIDRAVETAIGDGGHREELTRVTLQDHALLIEFLARRDAEGAEHAMAIHMLHAMNEMGLEQ